MFLSCFLGLVYVFLGAVTVLGSRYSCGERKVSYNNLILGGQKATAGKWPWHAAITHRTGASFQVVCGGSVIDKYTILTAAHCLYTRHGVIALNRVLVHVGRTQLSVSDSRSRMYTPDQFIIHPGYDQYHVKDDIALVRLSSAIEMSAFVLPVCLWAAEKFPTALTGRKGFVVGFGLNDADEASDNMLDAEVPVVDLWHCLESNREAFGTYLASTMLCAGARNSVGPCNGDSGGGLFFSAGNMWYIRGIVSFAPNRDGVTKCDPSQYTVYTDVAKYMDWISNIYENDTLNNPVRTSVELRLAQSLIDSEGCGEESPQFAQTRTENGTFGFPWVTTIEYVGVDYRRQNECLAYLITEWHLLTASSCVHDVEENEQEIFVRLGNFNIVGLSKPQIRFVEKIILHRQYNKPPYANDVALLKLRKKVNIENGLVNPICLPTAPNIAKPAKLVLHGSKKYFSQIESWPVVRVDNNNYCKIHYAKKGVMLPDDEQGFICTSLPLTGKKPSMLTTLPALLTNNHPNNKTTLVGFLPQVLSSSETSPYIAFVNIRFYKNWIINNL